MWRREAGGSSRKVRGGNKRGGEEESDERTASREELIEGGGGRSSVGKKREKEMPKPLPFYLISTRGLEMKGKEKEGGHQVASVPVSGVQLFFHFGMISATLGGTANPSGQLLAVISARKAPCQTINTANKPLSKVFGGRTGVLSPENGPAPPPSANQPGWLAPSGGADHFRATELHYFIISPQNLGQGKIEKTEDKMSTLARGARCR